MLRETKTHRSRLRSYKLFRALRSETLGLFSSLVEEFVATSCHRHLPHRSSVSYFCF